MNTAEIQRPASHWSRLEERGVYAGIRLMLFAYGLLGRVGFLVFLYPVIAYFYLTDAQARAASRRFLCRVYADPRGQSAFRRAPNWRDTYSHLFVFGEALLDKLAAWVGEINSETVIYENREVFEDLLNSNRGGLLIASHLGNSEVSRALGSHLLGRKINVLVHTKHSANFNRVMRRINPESTVSLTQVTEINPAVAMMLNEKVSNGEFVVIVGDRTPVEANQMEPSLRVSWASFLGHPAPFPQGPFILAGLLKCPVLTMFCLKREGRYHIIFEQFADVIDLPRRTREEAMNHWAARYAARLEKYCLSDPYQWFNLFDFWLQAGTTPPWDLSGEIRKEQDPHQKK
ncbi:MAG: hypothetical protein HOC72_10965 [Rhodospirillaceae bacterium]|jgi:predicted LPLAT superfamily acyltransferase|nr:hypothetical protein [Rhodospirillaceae bacterium]